MHAHLGDDPGGVAACSHGWSEVRREADFGVTRGRRRARTGPPR